MFKATDVLYTHWGLGLGKMEQIMLSVFHTHTYHSKRPLVVSYSGHLIIHYYVSLIKADVISIELSHETTHDSWTRTY